jgi:REP element-mobilizing transposase RayT
VDLDEWVIMPNHLHGISVINEPYNVVETPHRGVSTTWKSGTLGAIINQFKSEYTKRIRAVGWQSRFYDHIIRDDKSLRRIRVYIRNNPPKWTEDEINPGNW